MLKINEDLRSEILHTFFEVMDAGYGIKEMCGKIQELYKKIKKNKPKTFDEIKEFIINESRYRFWSRCEYEVIITGWPKQKREVKIDIFNQIMENIDVITTHFISHL